MTQYLILTVNREIEEREKILKALEPFQTVFEIFQAENASEAEQKLINLMENEEQLSLIICDESLPRTSGASFLTKLHKNSITRKAHKILLMHKPDVDVLIQAVNHGGIDHCLVPPWEGGDLTETVRQELTDFILDHEPDKLQFAGILDQERILGHMHEGGLTSWDHHS